MPEEKKIENPDWHCVEFENKTFCLSNVLTIPLRGGKPQIHRIARIGKDSFENMTRIYFNFIGISEPFYYVPASRDEIIKNENLVWYFDGSNTPIKMYFQN